MSPPTEKSRPTTGGSTSAENLIKAAHLILDIWEIRMSPSKVSRIARTYKHQVEKNGFAFIDFLANCLNASAEQRRKAVQNPDLAKVLTYNDPTGETAVNNILHGDAA
ncbi:hypothetical protein [Mycolicibacterium sp. OfavD-34-C]|uniref:hypothetical protein n=1 Tax=Mycolicibacterium sp. OfavD-34-C TaxID=2917746 RepID=UPI001EF44D6E|nr:hypothetical protein [Mycolicibacterium sp. OfavD-34-C]MCG7582777.1 hypothetical protein [Mycolicibacterium sp. OfavD-34-C]